MTISTEPASSPKSNSCLTIIKVNVAIIGGLIALCGFGGGIISFFMEWRSPQPIAVTQSLVVVAFVTLWVGLGSAVVWQAGRAVGQHPAALFRLPTWQRLIPIYGMVLIGGQAIIWFEVMPAFTLPPFHFLAAIMPVVFILAVVSRPVNLHWREIILQLSGGAFLATSLAFIVEILAVVGLFVIFTLLTPEGVSQLEEWQRQLQSNPRWLARQANIQEVLLFPPIVLTGLALFIIVAPLCEELFKVLGVLMMSYQQPTAGRVLVWGLAAGAGFAITENLFNTVLGVERWAFVMLLRIGATAMHCLGSGLIALGWQHLQAEGRPGKLVGAYGLSVCLHALWNAVTIGLASTSMVFIYKPDDPIWLAIGGFLAICLFLMLLTLTVSYLIAIGLISRRLANRGVTVAGS